MSSMRHLFVTRVSVTRVYQDIFRGGAPVYNYKKLDSMLDYYLDVPGEMMCRLDLNWVRPGVKQPQATEAAVAPSRFGTLFFDPFEGSDNDFISAGDRITCLSGPVSGTFELRVVPRPALGLYDVHHMEVEVEEVNKNLSGIFPRGGAI